MRNSLKFYLDINRINTVPRMAINYWSFNEARKYVRTLRLQNQREWYQYCKSNEKPSYIPSVPSSVYKKEWKGLGDWLATGTTAPQKKSFRSFEKARNLARDLKLKNYTEWIEYAKSNKRPIDIPSNPRRTYRKEWKGVGDWLGTGNIASFKRKFRSFKEARKYARNLELKNFTEWIECCKAKKVPFDIPTTPSRTYKNTGWQGWGDWLGTGNIAPYNRKFLSFKKARKYVRTIELKKSSEWFTFARSNKKPDNIPVDPSQTYKKFWISWRDWLFPTET